MSNDEKTEEAKQQDSPKETFEQSAQQVRSDDLQFMEQQNNKENNQQSQENNQKCQFEIQPKQELQHYEQQQNRDNSNNGEDIMIIQQQMQENIKELIKVKQLNEDLLYQNQQLESLIEENKNQQEIISEQKDFIKVLNEQMKCQDLKLIQLQNQMMLTKQSKNNQSDVHLLEYLQSQCQHFFKTRLSKDIFEKINKKVIELQKQINQLKDLINKQNSVLKQQSGSQSSIIFKCNDESLHQNQQLDYDKNCSYYELKYQLAKEQSYIQDLLVQDKANKMLIQKLNQENLNYIQVQQYQAHEMKQLANINQELEQKIKKLNEEVKMNSEQISYFEEKVQQYFKRTFHKKIFKEFNEEIKQKNNNYDLLLNEYQNQKYFNDSVNSEYTKYFQYFQYFQYQLQPEFFKQISEQIQQIQNEKNELLLENQLQSEKLQQNYKNKLKKLQDQMAKESEILQNYQENCKQLNKKCQELERIVRQNEQTIKQQSDELNENVIKKIENEKEFNKDKQECQSENVQLKNRFFAIDKEMKDYIKEKEEQLICEQIKFSKLQKENEKIQQEFNKTKEDLNNLRDQKNLFLQTTLQEKQVIKFELLDLQNRKENYEMQLNYENQEINQLKVENQNLNQEMTKLKLLFFSKQVDLEKEHNGQILLIQNQLTDKQNKQIQLQKQLEQKDIEAALSIQSIKQLEWKFKKEEENVQKEQQILKSNISFILKKIQPNQKVQQIIPLISQLQQLTFNTQNNQIIDPFNDQQIMIQEDQFRQLEISFNYKPFLEILLNNHPPDFNQVVILKERQELVPIKRSININKTSSFFNGYFIRILNEKNKLYYIREQKFKNQIEERELLLTQIGNRYILEIIISAFNQELKKQNIAYPDMKLPPILCLKGQNYYYYCEQMIQYQNINQDSVKINLYLNALRYFSYCYSKGAYMITQIIQQGNYLGGYLYDVIISSKYGILSSYDQGQDEILELTSRLNPRIYNYSQYQQLMLSMKL